MMNGCLASPLSADRLNELVLHSKDYLLSHGIIIRTKEDPLSAEKAMHVSCVLLPSPVPRHCYIKAKAIQKDLNILMHKVAHDSTFLKKCLKSTIKHDDFTARLYNIYEKVQNDGIKQPYDLAIIRSDYMLDSGIPTVDLLTSDTKVTASKVNIKQIEINTIAAGLGGLASKLGPFHKYMLNKMGLYDQSQELPENKAPEGIAEAFIAAWSKYGKPEAVILFVVQEREWNIYDQRQLEYEVNRINPRVMIIRQTINDLVQTASLGKDSQLLLDGREVAVVYLRAFYTPDDFKSENDWAVRLLIEQSAAIKCPSIHYQLVGTKKVQQELARPGVLETYLSNPDAISAIRDCFAGQYSLEMGAEGDESVAMAMGSPEKFVLKPQREGGGNNIFGEDIRRVLNKIGQTEERTAYILMERIHPVPMQNYPIVSGKPVETEPIDMVSEIGVFGMLLGCAKDVELNIQKGHILRSKLAGIDEGGVSSGGGMADSPHLIK